MDTEETVEKRKPWCTQECKLVQPLWKTAWKFLKKLKIEIPFDSTIFLLGVRPNKMKLLSQRDIYVHVLIATVFTTTKTWKQPMWWVKGERKCDLYRQWDIVLRHSVMSDSLWPHGLWLSKTPLSVGIFQARKLEWVAISFSSEILFSYKKEDNSAFATTQVNLEGTIQPETIQRKTSTVWYHLYVDSMHQTQKQSRMVGARGWWLGKIGECSSKGETSCSNNFQRSNV